MKVVYLQTTIFVRLILFVAGQPPPSHQTGPSISTTSACTSCAVAAEEFYLSYPYSISTIAAPVTVTVVPYITPHANGSRETNWRTETQGSKGPASINGQLGTQTPNLTWEPYSGVTLTYPTTYVNFPSPYGGLHSLSNGACVTATSPLVLPTNSEQGLIYPVTISDWDTKLPWNVTQQMLEYLDRVPAVSQQFHGTKVGSCEWATYVTPTSSLLPITKITVQYLIAQTAQAIVVSPESIPASTSNSPPSAFTKNAPTATSTTSVSQSPVSSISSTSSTSVLTSVGMKLSPALRLSAATIFTLIISSSISLIAS